MKNNLLSAFLFLVCATTTQLLSQRVWAQTAAATTPAGMSLDQLKAIKAIKIANLDKDTYFKADGFILDRYEERPAYVFTYSDGITRKIYLYKIFKAEDTKDLGLLAIYQNGKTGEVKPFVIPGASADRKVWDAYIDDLKYVGEKEPGLMSTLTFVLSREMAGLLAGGGGKADDDGKKKEEYNFCFAPDAPVTMADGSARAISDIVMNDVVLGYDAATKTIRPTRVARVGVHRSRPETLNSFALSGVWLTPDNPLTADNRAALPAPTLLEATANHPVLTAAGRQPLGDLKTGDVLYRYENGRTVAYRVVQTQKQTRPVSAVYNLTTEAGAYFVGETLVLDK